MRNSFLAAACFPDRVHPNPQRKPRFLEHCFGADTKELLAVTTAPAIIVGSALRRVPSSGTRPDSNNEGTRADLPTVAAPEMRPLSVHPLTHS